MSVVHDPDILGKAIVLVIWFVMWLAPITPFLFVGYLALRFLRAYENRSRDRAP